MTRSTLPKVSVIVPVWNLEGCLAKCLQSLVEQTLAELEIIVVNRGSKDRSGEIIDHYATLHPNVVKVNSGITGLGGIRNRGVEIAQGEYIGFVDGDDWVDRTMFERMYQMAKDSEAALCQCGFIYVYPNATLCKNIEATTLTSRQLLTEDLMPSVCNKIFHREIIRRNPFPEDLWFEDLGLVAKLLARPLKIANVPAPLYYYWKHPDGITATASEKISDILLILADINSYYSELGLFADYYTELEYINVSKTVATKIPTICRLKTGGGKIFAAFADHLNSLFPNWPENPYLRGLNYKQKTIIYLFKNKRYRALCLLTKIRNLLTRAQSYRALRQSEKRTLALPWRDGVE